MLSIKQLALGVLLTSLSVVCGCDTKNTHVVRGSRAAGTHFAISGGNLLTRRGEPGMLFGTARSGDAQERLTYVVVFRNPPGELNRFAQQGKCKAKGQSGQTESVIQLNNHKIETSYQISYDEEWSVETESLKIGEKEVNVKSGRLFVIDLTTSIPTYQQIQAELSSEIASLETLEDVERIVEETFKTLKPHLPEGFAE